MTYVERLPGAPAGELIFIKSDNLRYSKDSPVVGNLPQSWLAETQRPFRRVSRRGSDRSKSTSPAITCPVIVAFARGPRVPGRHLLDQLHEGASQFAMRVK